jgi:hypothetical protein
VKSGKQQKIEQLGAQLVLALRQFQGNAPSANADATVSELHKQVKAALPHMRGEALQTLLIILNVVKASVQKGLVTAQVGNDFFAMATAFSQAPTERPAHKAAMAKNTVAPKMATVLNLKSSKTGPENTPSV